MNKIKPRKYVKHKGDKRIIKHLWVPRNNRQKLYICLKTLKKVKSIHKDVLANKQYQ